MRLTRLLALLIIIATGAISQTPAAPSPTQIASEQDRQKMLDLLHIGTLRQGANGSNPDAPNAANHDESKANPYPDLPDPLVMKNGKKVTTSAMWWNQRRPEIVEDFDREIYGRMPKNTPAVKWEVTGTSTEKTATHPSWSRSWWGMWIIHPIRPLPSTFNSP